MNFFFSINFLDGKNESVEFLEKLMDYKPR